MVVVVSIWMLICARHVMYCQIYIYTAAVVTKLMAVYALHMGAGDVWYILIVGCVKYW
jgi:hypothetical protein